MFCTKMQIKHRSLVSYTWWPSTMPSIPPTEQAGVSCRYLMIPLVPPPLWPLWPHHPRGKLTLQRQDMWTLQAQGSKSVDLLPCLYPNLSMLTCSNLFLLASRWEFTDWINRINGVSGYLTMVPEPLCPMIAAATCLAVLGG